MERKNLKSAVNQQRGDFKPNFMTVFYSFKVKLVEEEEAAEGEGESCGDQRRAEATTGSLQDLT